LRRRKRRAARTTSPTCDRARDQPWNLTCLRLVAAHRQNQLPAAFRTFPFSHDFQGPLAATTRLAYALTLTETNSGLQWEFCIDFTASSAVNLPITSASLRLVVV
jgi:hypothetical protein